MTSKRANHIKHCPEAKSHQAASQLPNPLVLYTSLAFLIKSAIALVFFSLRSSEATLNLGIPV